MGKKIKHLLLTTIMIIGFSMFAMADQPPDPGGGPGGGDDPVGGGSPVGSGLAILMALGIGYGSKKIYDIRNRLK
jgi:hypothetical protein